MFKILVKNERILIAQTLANKGDDEYGFNLALHVHDDSGAVLGRRAAFLAQLSLVTEGKVRSLLWLNQVHGGEVYDVSQTLPVVPPSADAAISDGVGLGLCIMTADCVPIVLFDEHKIANVHAGWQGLVQGIIKNTHDKFDKKTPIYAYIGACIGEDCYEIPMAMAERIVLTCRACFDLDEKTLWQTMTDKGDGKVWFAIGKLAMLQLTSLGITILNDHLECTYTGNYFSHRKATHQHKPHTGRMAMVVAKLS